MSEDSQTKLLIDLVTVIEELQLRLAVNDRIIQSLIEQEDNTSSVFHYLGRVLESPNSNNSLVPVPDSKLIAYQEVISCKRQELIDLLDKRRREYVYTGP